MQKDNLPQSVNLIVFCLSIAALVTVAAPIIADEGGIFFMYSMPITLMVGAPILMGLAVRWVMMKIQSNYYIDWLLLPIMSWLAWAGIYTLIVNSQLKISTLMVLLLIFAAAIGASIWVWYLKRTLRENKECNAVATKR